MGPRGVGRAACHAARRRSRAPTADPAAMSPPSASRVSQAAPHSRSVDRGTGAGPMRPAAACQVLRSAPRPATAGATLAAAAGAGDGGGAPAPPAALPGPGDGAGATGTPGPPDSGGDGGAVTPIRFQSGALVGGCQGIRRSTGTLTNPNPRARYRWITWRRTRGVVFGPAWSRTIDPGTPADAADRTDASVAWARVSPSVTSHRITSGKPAAAAAASDAGEWRPYGGRKSGAIGMPVTRSTARAFRRRSTSTWWLVRVRTSRWR